MDARRDFGKLCWRRITNGNYYKHQAYLHIWCGHCRPPFWDTHHKTRSHMEDRTCCAAPARCMRCNETWETINRNGKPDEHLKTCVHLKKTASEYKFGVEDAERHTVECAETMGQKREYKAKEGENKAKAGQKTVPPRNNHAYTEMERIRGVLEGHCGWLPPRCRENADLAILQELGKDNDHPLGLKADTMMEVFRRFTEDIRDARETMRGMKDQTRPHKGSQMSLDQYFERLPKTFDGPNKFKPGDWVVCTARQALIILMCHHPFLVLRGVDDPLGEDACMQNLEDTSRQTYAFHDLTKRNPAKEEGGVVQKTMDPSRMPFQTFLAAQESQERPLNMLSLPVFRSSPPDFLAQPNYDLVNSCIPEHAGWAKLPTDAIRDCASFGLCALGGAVSVWHMHQNGFDTAAVCEFGRKLWVLVQGMPLQRSAVYARQMHRNREGYVGPDEAVGWPIVGVPLRAGHVLVQPVGMLYVPYGVSGAVGFSGYMIWGMMGMVRYARVVRLEVREEASNEDVLEGLVERLLSVPGCWARAIREKKVGWPGGEELKLFRMRLRNFRRKRASAKRRNAPLADTTL
ncbi:hypothetical protein CONLIGDRAFT_686758 [Coniochaeta ligniaria NRRL 30616]|uniref:JmjC domain-containing protein n=1 Tax=Coniochaeta ligniaria NRRL 30616 TaxID=1408157 RepID=A0A1J7I6Q0_9PEZI|nr:hypothetical protein CONLIGDRAFT_686758 [Coniochaeta ligniaria NRRL 30616]